MAIGIFNKTDGIMFKVALNDAAKQYININESDYDVVTISDALYSDIIKTKKWAKLENGSVVEGDVGVNEKFVNAEHLQFDINNRLELIKGWLINNHNKDIYNDVKNYASYLKSLDVSTFSFPMTQTIEEYCEANGVTFFHPLQL